MNSLSLSPTEEYIIINLVNISSIIIKDTFAHIGDKIDELPNHRRETVARDIIRFFLVKTE